MRRRYLGIDDEVAARLRSDITRLLRFPDAVADGSQAPTLVERLLNDKLPRRLFELLMTYEERDVCEVPGIGQALHNFIMSYYGFRQNALVLETHIITEIGKMVAVRFPAAWR